MSTLLLRLGGALQSWGSDSKYDERWTDAMPTKSGVIGMIASAMGRKRDDNVDDLSVLQFGIRIDQSGTIIDDLQTTIMGKGLNDNISHRKYLSDALFIAGFEGDGVFLHNIEQALLYPKYPLFLGRRSCPPTLPIILGIRDSSLYEALYNEPWQSPVWQQHRLNHTLRIILDSESKGAAIKRDVPVSFSPYLREYTYRFLEEKPPRIIIDTFHEHDALSELR